ncbi:MAG: LAGLIDADG family homing endonuclease [Candidatus Aenigmatarchaeota archaeon]
MRRFSSKEKDSIIKLRKRGKSLNQICNILKVNVKNKSSIYFHLRKNFGRSYKLVKLNLSNQNLIGEVMGLFAADGSAVPQTDYQIRFHLSLDEKKYAKDFKSVLKEVFNKIPSIYETERNSISIRYRSKVIYEFIKNYLFWEGKKTYTIKLKSLNHTNKFLIGFLRGYFDGDGYSRKESKTAEIVTTSKNMHNQLKDILSLLNLSFSTRIYNDKRRKRHTAYYIYLRKLDAVKFIRLIGPRNPKRMRNWGPVV